MLKIKKSHLRHDEGWTKSSTILTTGLGENIESWNSKIIVRYNVTITLKGQLRDGENH